MNDNSKEFTVSYCNYNSILVVNASGRLRQVYTPFKVFDANSMLKKVYIVDEVLSTNDNKLVYLINGKHYFHHHFIVDIHF